MIEPTEDLSVENFPRDAICQILPFKFPTAIPLVITIQFHRHSLTLRVL
jgi:hypothetical protein